MTVASYACPVAGEPGKTVPHAPEDPATAATVDGAGALDAWRLAAEAHAGQRRSADRRPYIHHPERVAVLVAGEGGDDAMVAASLLHDVIEDTEIENDRIERDFGPDVASLVAAMTNDPTIDDYEARKRALRDRVREAGERVVLIYAADKLANLRDMRSLYANVGDAAAGRFKAPIDVRLRLWRRDAEMVARLMPGLGILVAFRSELDAFDAERATTA